jgi:hypothetical protein
MPALSIQPPFSIFTDTDGQPLENGYIWIGTANQNPITNPITAYWDAALTVTAAQPVRTLNGYPVNAGTPARLYVNSDYSIQVQNKNGSVVYSAPAATERLSADLVTFIQAGSGAVTRTAQAKMRESVSVKDFGATGDGVTDDTAAIQAALTAAGANDAAVIFPFGEYLVTSGLNVPANVKIEGNNSTVKTNSAFNLFTFADGGGISNTILIGSVLAGVYSAASSAIKASGTNNHPAAPTYIAGPIVENCTINNFGYMGVSLAYVKEAKIKNNKMLNIGYAGVGGVSCNDTIVDGNTITAVTPGSPGGDAYGIFIDRENGLAETSDPRSYRCIITNNIVKNVTVSFGSNGQGIDTHAGVDFVIDGNVVQDCQYGIFITSSVIGALGQQLGALRCVVSNNTISGGNTGYGIMVNGANNGGVLVEHTRDCVISGNTISGFGSAGDVSIGALQLQWTKDTIVSGNIIKNSRVNCVNLNGPNIGVNISGNIFIDPFDNAVTSPACIRVRSDDNRGYIGNNTYRYENGALGTYVATNSIRIESSLTSLDIDFGRSAFQGIDATHLTFTALTTTGVRYAGLDYSSGSGTISVTSTGADGVTDVSFPKRLPYVPTVTVTLRRPFNQGGKFPILGIDTSVAISATGFRIYALPYDGTTWTATGSLSFDWEAK